MNTCVWIIPCYFTGKLRFVAFVFLQPDKKYYGTNMVAFLLILVYITCKNCQKSYPDKVLLGIYKGPDIQLDIGYWKEVQESLCRIAQGSRWVKSMITRWIEMGRSKSSGCDGLKENHLGLSLYLGSVWVTSLQIYYLFDVTAGSV